MSAGIHARVLARRAAVTRARQEDEDRLRFLADARGEPGEPGMRWCGEWSPRVEYAAGDAVQHKGSAYIAVAPNTDVKPPSVPWDLLAAKGRDGQPGRDGCDGRSIVLGGGGSASFSPGSLPVLDSAPVLTDALVLERGGVAYRVSLSQLQVLLAEGSAEMPAYAKRLDFVSDALFYRGAAAPGSAESAPVWRISRVIIGADGDMTEEWAGGSSQFDQIWDARASLSYS